MSYCHVSNQIDIHCNEQEEDRCPECDNTMTFDDERREILVCDDEECRCEVDTQPGYDFD